MCIWWELCAVVKFNRFRGLGFFYRDILKNKLLNNEVNLLKLDEVNDMFNIAGSSIVCLRRMHATDSHDVCLAVNVRQGHYARQGWKKCIFPRKIVTFQTNFPPCLCISLCEKSYLFIYLFIYLFMLSLLRVTKLQWQALIFKMALIHIHTKCIIPSKWSNFPGRSFPDFPLWHKICFRMRNFPEGNLNLKDTPKNKQIILS